MTATHLTESDYTKTFPEAVDEFPAVEDQQHYIDAWELNSLFNSIKTTQEYLITYKAGIEATVKDSYSGADGVKVVPIPAGRYPAGKTCTAQDADLVAANIKDGGDNIRNSGVIISRGDRNKPGTFHGGQSCYYLKGNWAQQLKT